MKDKHYLLVRFGRKLRTEREARNLSQEALSHKSKISRNTISLIEVGGKSKGPTLDVIDRLAEALDISIVRLMDF